MQKFDVILVDPPWPYPNRNKGGSFGLGAIGHYNLMTIDDIIETFKCISDVASDNCAVFIWATHPKLKELLKCVEELEKHKFRYATCAFTWVKVNKDGSVFKGVGNYTGSNTEPCYLIVRGKKPVSEKLVQSVVLHPKMRHSQKPEQFQDLIERMYPPDNNKYLEVFARRNRKNWKCIGIELDGKDIRESLKDLPCGE
jgi:N6-adenosine-specific RNA methylase IME4